MDHAGIARHRHRHARLAQPRGIRLALVTERVVFRGDDESRRQSLELRRGQRRGVGLGPVLRALEVVVPEPAHRIPREQVAVGVVAIRPRVEVVLRDRIGEHLERQRGTAPVAAHEADGGGEVPARAVTADGQAPPVDAETPGLAGDPLGRRVRVFGGDGVLVLGGEAVVDARHDRSRGIGERAADAVMRLDVADHPAAAMEVDVGGEGPATRRGIAPHGDCPAVDGHPVIVDARDVLHRAERGGARAHALAGLGRGHLLRGRQAERRRCVEDLLGLRIEWHGASPPHLSSGGSELRDVPTADGRRALH